MKTRATIEKKSRADRRLLFFICADRQETDHAWAEWSFRRWRSQNCWVGDEKFVAFSWSCDFFQKITKITKNAFRGNPDLQFLVCFLLVSQSKTPMQPMYRLLLLSGGIFCRQTEPKATHRMQSAILLRDRQKRPCEPRLTFTSRRAKCRKKSKKVTKKRRKNPH